MHARSATLSIAAVGPQDAGRYQCEAENERGVSSQSLWLDVYGESSAVHSNRLLSAAKAWDVCY